MEGWFNWLGIRLGEILRWVVDLLSIFFSSLGDSLQGFVDGMTEALGISPSVFGLMALLLGLWLLYRALSALRRRAPLAALLWALLGVTVLGWLIG